MSHKSPCQGYFGDEGEMSPIQFPDDNKADIGMHWLSSHDDRIQSRSLSEPVQLIYFNFPHILLLTGATIFQWNIIVYHTRQHPFLNPQKPLRTGGVTRKKINCVLYLLNFHSQYSIECNSSKICTAVLNPGLGMKCNKIVGWASPMYEPRVNVRLHCRFSAII